MPADQAILTTHDAARLLGVHVETVRRLARKGEIPCFKIGKDWRFQRETLLQWMTNGHRAQHPPCILVLDDEGSIRKLMRRYLEAEGYRVETAADGMGGLSCLEKTTVDLISLDLNMPKMNGPDFLRELRRAYPDMPVIVVTGYPVSGLIKEAFIYGPLILIPKPIDRRELIRAVTMALNGTDAAKGSSAAIL